ncbi:MAG TPA: cation:proton antiporter [Saprospiraceae bacterium]
MTITIIIILCTLLLLAYVFDISSPLTKIPSVILLLVLGWLFHRVLDFFDIVPPDLNVLLPILGTIGLILIVLEGALEVELNQSKISVIKKSSLMAVLTLVVLALSLGYIIHARENVPFRIALLNAIPFCVISSSIAIPSVKNLPQKDKEFVIYESSLSDIFGVLLFNFVAVNHFIHAKTIGLFFVQLLLMFSISFVSVAGLSLLLSRNKHHITYSPIILMVILIYAGSKILHLPGLLFILIFGLFLGNLDELKRFKWINYFKPERLDTEVAKFKDITAEATFLIRALFFMLFGFLLQTQEIINLETLPWAVAIAFGIVITRWIALWLLKLPVLPLLFIAPRGLITILLFLAIISIESIPFVNSSLVIQTIIISVLFMMIGLVIFKPSMIGK